eukprot:TRINITY_DN7114_c0_g1_i1.p1 TRINITY_DN7114_c0_g1~~TRINITY_DN7114_c0_g1_i1.p1  ORF type:complete len:290 (-),score=75.61 TRINITY_DN7114_c0_g1_i1:383-1252(-)
MCIRDRYQRRVRGKMATPSWALAATAGHPQAAQTEQPTQQVVQQAQGYIGGIKIWGTGMMDDPNPGSKRGKGVQHLNSDFWIGAMGVFIAEHLELLTEIIERTRHQSAGWQYQYYLNQSNMLAMDALKQGLQTREAEEAWLMAAWWCMAAAEVDGYILYTKYSPEQRDHKKAAFFDAYLHACAERQDGPQIPNRLVAPAARIDLLPAVALERLSLHNELCQVKYGDEANGWMKEGFQLSKRIDSLKRHMDEAHHQETHEDAVAHLIWNFMAVFHVLKVHPSRNDLIRYD